MNRLPKMNPRLLPYLMALAFAFCGANAIAQTATDPNEGSRLTRDPATGLYNLSWWGRTGRTYFLQQSENLADWTYLPMIESGAGQVIRWGTSFSAARSFLRLKYSDLPTANPFTASFDADKISNWDELQQGTDPFVAALDVNGLPFDWETFYQVAFHTPANDYTPAGNGLTYLQTFEHGYNPNDYYHGQPPAMMALSGTPQTGPKGGYVPLPLVAQVAQVSGEPLVNAPVTFSVTSGGGLVQASQSQPLRSSLTVRTDFSGQAKVFFQLPNIADQTCYVRAAAGGENQPVFADFVETSDNGSRVYASPFDPSNVTATLNADGSGVVTWTNNTDSADQEPIVVQYTNAAGQRVTLATVPAGTTSYTIPAQHP